MEIEWNQRATKQLISDVYGKAQMMLARNSLDSMAERPRFAHFHLVEVIALWEEHAMEIQNLPMGEALAPSDTEVRARYAERSIKTNAHVHACVQSLHAVPDILAHALYYGLALDKKSSLRELNIDYTSVKAELGKDSSLQSLCTSFESVCAGDDYKYLAALNNHGKHRSIVNNGVAFSMGPEAKLPSLHFFGFTYRGANYDWRAIIPFLSSEYERISLQMIECGIELQKALELAKSRPQA